MIQVFQGRAKKESHGYYQDKAMGLKKKEDRIFLEAFKKVESEQYYSNTKDIMFGRACRFRASQIS